MYQISILLCQFKQNLLLLQNLAQIIALNNIQNIVLGS